MASKNNNDTPRNKLLESSLQASLQIFLKRAILIYESANFLRASQEISLFFDAFEHFL